MVYKYQTNIANTIDRAKSANKVLKQPIIIAFVGGYYIYDSHNSIVER